MISLVAGAGEVDGIAARVGSAVILKSDIANEMRRSGAGAEKYADIRDEMIEREQGYYLKERSLTPERLMYDILMIDENADMIMFGKSVSRYIALSVKKCKMDLPEDTSGSRMSPLR